MLQQELLIRVIAVLDQSGIDYMITGSVASSLQGEPRSTNDIDIVVTIHPESVPAFVAAFPQPQFYLEETAVREAVRTKGFFNLIDVNHGFKVDFYLLTQEPFDRSRFSRKRVENVFGLKLKISSPEDTILMKLRWSELSGGSEKQFQDARSVYLVQAETLDFSYLDRWADHLGIKELLRRVQSEE